MLIRGMRSFIEFLLFSDVEAFLLTYFMISDFIIKILRKIALQWFRFLLSKILRVYFLQNYVKIIKHKSTFKFTEESRIYSIVFEA